MFPFKSLTKKYQEIKTDYMSRSPKGKWMFVRDFGQMFLKPIGISFMDPKFKVTWYSYVSAIVLIDILLSFFYTVWYYFGRETIQGFLVVSLLGVLTSAFLGYLLVIIPSNCKRLTSLTFFACDYNIYTDITDDTDPAYIRISERSANNLTRSLFQTLAIYGISMVVYITFPVHHFIVHQEIHLVIPVLFPFTDLSTISGIIFNMANQLFTASIGICGTFGVEVVVCMLKNSFDAASSATCYSIDVMRNAFNKTKLFPNRIVEIHFRNIVIQLKDLDRFLAEIIDLGYWKFFMQSLTLNLSIALSLFFYLRGIWIAGLGITLVSYVQLFVLCDLGSHINSANELVMQKLSKMPWYSMSKQNQLTYAHLLNRLQNGVVLNVGPFAELNLVTFSKMTNKIYSLVMTLRRVLD